MAAFCHWGSDLNGLFSGIASSTLEEPFGASLTLGVISVQDLVPAGELWIVRVSEFLGDDALRTQSVFRFVLALASPAQLLPHFDGI